MEVWPDDQLYIVLMSVRLVVVRELGKVAEIHRRNNPNTSNSTSNHFTALGTAMSPDGAVL